MLLAGLHPIRRNRPGPRIEVEFFPSRAPDLTTAGSSENTEFERTRCNARASGQLGHESCHIRIRQCRMVLDSPHFRSSRQQFVEMPLQARRILTLSVSPDRRPVEDGLDPPAHTADGLGLRRPDGFEDAQNCCGVDIGNGASTNLRVSAWFERQCTLLPVFCILPGRTVTDDVSLFTAGKRLRLLNATSLQDFDPTPFDHGVDASLSLRRNSPARSLASTSGTSGSRPVRYWHGTTTDHVRRGH